MSQKVDFDPNAPISAENVDQLTVDEILQRFQVLNRNADSVLALSTIVARTPSISGVAQVWKMNVEVGSELYLLAGSLQRRMVSATEQIEALKKIST